MKEAKERKSDATAPGDRDAESKDSDATSSETLSDLEERGQLPDTGSDDGASSTPSPDGAFDDDERGSGDDAGLM